MASRQRVDAMEDWFGFAELTDVPVSSAAEKFSEELQKDDVTENGISHASVEGESLNCVKNVKLKRDVNEIVVPIISEKLGIKKYKVLARQKVEDDDSEGSKTKKNTVHQTSESNDDKRKECDSKTEIPPARTKGDKSHILDQSEPNVAVKLKKKSVKPLKRLDISSLPNKTSVSSKALRTNGANIRIKKRQKSSQNKPNDVLKKECEFHDKLDENVKKDTALTNKLKKTKREVKDVTVTETDNVVQNSLVCRTDSNIELLAHKKVVETATKSKEGDSCTIIPKDAAKDHSSNLVASPIKCTVKLKRDPSIDSLHKLAKEAVEAKAGKSILTPSTESDLKNDESYTQCDDTSSVSSETSSKESFGRQKSVESKTKTIDMIYNADIEVRKSGRLKSAKCASRYRGDYGIRADAYTKIACKQTSSTNEDVQIPKQSNEPNCEDTEMIMDTDNGDFVQKEDVSSNKEQTVEGTKPETSIDDKTCDNVTAKKQLCSSQAKVRSKQKKKVRARDRNSLDLKRENMSSKATQRKPDSTCLKAKSKSHSVVDLVHREEIVCKQNLEKKDSVMETIVSVCDKDCNTSGKCEACAQFQATGIENQHLFNSKSVCGKGIENTCHSSEMPMEGDLSHTDVQNCDSLDLVPSCKKNIASVCGKDLGESTMELDNQSPSNVACSCLEDRDDIAVHSCEDETGLKTTIEESITCMINSFRPFTLPVSRESGYTHSVGKSVNKKENQIIDKTSSKCELKNAEQEQNDTSKESSPEMISKCVDHIEILESLRAKLMENAGVDVQVVNEKPKQFESKLISSKLKASKTVSKSDCIDSSGVPETNCSRSGRSTPRSVTPRSVMENYGEILEEVAETLNSMHKAKRKAEASSRSKPKPKRQRFEQKKFLLRSMLKRTAETEEDENINTNEKKIKLDMAQSGNKTNCSSKYDSDIVDNTTESVQNPHEFLSSKSELSDVNRQERKNKSSKSSAKLTVGTFKKAGSVGKSEEDEQKLETNDDCDSKKVSLKPKTVTCQACGHSYKSKELLRRHYPCRVRQTRTWSQNKLRPHRAVKRTENPGKADSKFVCRLPKSKAANKARPKLLTPRKTKFRRVKGKRRRKLYQLIQELKEKRKIVDWPHLNVLWENMSFKEQHLYKLGLICVGNPSNGAESYSTHELELFEEHRKIVIEEIKQAIVNSTAELSSVEDDIEQLPSPESTSEDKDLRKTDKTCTDKTLEDFSSFDKNDVEAEKGDNISEALQKPQTPILPVSTSDTTVSLATDSTEKSLQESWPGVEGIASDEKVAMIRPSSSLDNTVGNKTDISTDLAESSVNLDNLEEPVIPEGKLGKEIIETQLEKSQENNSLRIALSDKPLICNNDPSEHIDIEKFAALEITNSHLCADGVQSEKESVNTSSDLMGNQGDIEALAEFKDVKRQFCEKDVQINKQSMETNINFKENKGEITDEDPLCPSNREENPEGKDVSDARFVANDKTSEETCLQNSSFTGSEIDTGDELKICNEVKQALDDSMVSEADVSCKTVLTLNNDVANDLVASMEQELDILPDSETVIDLNETLEAKTDLACKDITPSNQISQGTSSVTDITEAPIDCGLLEDKNVPLDHIDASVELTSAKNTPVLRNVDSNELLELKVTTSEHSEEKLEMLNNSEAYVQQVEASTYNTLEVEKEIKDDTNEINQSLELEHGINKTPDETVEVQHKGEEYAHHDEVCVDSTPVIEKETNKNIESLELEHASSETFDEILKVQHEDDAYTHHETCVDSTSLLQKDMEEIHESLEQEHTTSEISDEHHKKKGYIHHDKACADDSEMTENVTDEVNEFVELEHNTSSEIHDEISNLQHENEAYIHHEACIDAASVIEKDMNEIETLKLEDPTSENPDENEVQHTDEGYIHHEAAVSMSVIEKDMDEIDESLGLKHPANEHQNENEVQKDTNEIDESSELDHPTNESRDDKVEVQHKSEECIHHDEATADDKAETESVTLEVDEFLEQEHTGSENLNESVEVKHNTEGYMHQNEACVESTPVIEKDKDTIIENSGLEHPTSDSGEKLKVHHESEGYTHHDNACTDNKDMIQIENKEKLEPTSPENSDEKVDVHHKNETCISDMQNTVGAQNTGHVEEKEIHHILTPEISSLSLSTEDNDEYNYNTDINQEWFGWKTIGNALHKVSKFTEKAPSTIPEVEKESTSNELVENTDGIRTFPEIVEDIKGIFDDVVRMAEADLGNYTDFVQDNDNFAPCDISTALKYATESVKEENASNVRIEPNRTDMLNLSFSSGEMYDIETNDFGSDDSLVDEEENHCSQEFAEKDKESIEKVNEDSNSNENDLFTILKKNFSDIVDIMTIEKDKTEPTEDKQSLKHGVINSTSTKTESSSSDIPMASGVDQVSAKEDFIDLTEEILSDELVTIGQHTDVEPKVSAVSENVKADVVDEKLKISEVSETRCSASENNEQVEDLPHHTETATLLTDNSPAEEFHQIGVILGHRVLFDEDKALSAMNAECEMFRSDRSVCKGEVDEHIEDDSRVPESAINVSLVQPESKSDLNARKSDRFDVLNYESEKAESKSFDRGPNFGRVSADVESSGPLDQNTHQSYSGGERTDNVGEILAKCAISGHDALKTIEKKEHETAFDIKSKNTDLNCDEPVTMENDESTTKIQQQAMESKLDDSVTGTTNIDLEEQDSCFNESIDKSQSDYIQQEQKSSEREQNDEDIFSCHQDACAPMTDANDSCLEKDDAQSFVEHDQGKLAGESDHELDLIVHKDSPLYDGKNSSTDNEKSECVIKYEVNGILISENLITGDKTVIRKSNDEITASESEDIETQESVDSLSESENEHNISSAHKNDVQHNIGEYDDTNIVSEPCSSDTSVRPTIQEVFLKDEEDDDHGSIKNTDMQNSIDNCSIDEDDPNLKSKAIDSENVHLLTNTNDNESNISEPYLESLDECSSPKSISAQVHFESQSEIDEDLPKSIANKEEIESVRSSDDRCIDKNVSLNLVGYDIEESEYSNLSDDSKHSATSECESKSICLSNDSNLTPCASPDIPPILEKVNESFEVQDSTISSEDSVLFNEDGPPVLEPVTETLDTEERRERLDSDNQKSKGERHFLDILGVMEHSIEEDNTEPNTSTRTSDHSKSVPENKPETCGYDPANEAIGRHFSDVVIDSAVSQEKAPKLQLQHLINKSENGEVTLSEIREILKPKSNCEKTFSKQSLLKMRSGIANLLSKIDAPLKKDPAWLKRDSLFAYQRRKKKTKRRNKTADVEREMFYANESDLSDTDMSEVESSHSEKESSDETGTSSVVSEDTTEGSITSNILQMLNSLEDKGSVASNMSNLLGILAENLGFLGKSTALDDSSSDSEYSYDGTDHKHLYQENMTSTLEMKSRMFADWNEAGEGPPPLDEIPTAGEGDSELEAQFVESVNENLQQVNVDDQVLEIEDYEKAHLFKNQIVEKDPESEELDINKSENVDNDECADEDKTMEETVEMYGTIENNSSGLDDHLRLLEPDKMCKLENIIVLKDTEIDMGHVSEARKNDELSQDEEHICDDIEDRINDTSCVKGQDILPGVIEKNEEASLSEKQLGPDGSNNGENAETVNSDVSTNLSQFEEKAQACQFQTVRNEFGAEKISSVSTSSSSKSKANTIFKSITELNSIETDDEDSSTEFPFNAATISQNLTALKVSVKSDASSDVGSDLLSSLSQSDDDACESDDHLKSTDISPCNSKAGNRSDLPSDALCTKSGSPEKGKNFESESQVFEMDALSTSVESEVNVKSDNTLFTDVKTPSPRDHSDLEMNDSVQHKDDDICSKILQSSPNDGSTNDLNERAVGVENITFDSKVIDDELCECPPVLEAQEWQKENYQDDAFNTKSSTCESQKLDHLDKEMETAMPNLSISVDSSEVTGVLGAISETSSVDSVECNDSSEESDSGESDSGEESGSENTIAVDSHKNSNESVSSEKIGNHDVSDIATVASDENDAVLLDNADVDSEKIGVSDKATVENDANDAVLLDNTDFGSEKIGVSDKATVENDANDAVLLDNADDDSIDDTEIFSIEEMEKIPQHLTETTGVLEPVQAVVNGTECIHDTTSKLNKFVTEAESIVDFSRTGEVPLQKSFQNITEGGTSEVPVHCLYAEQNEKTTEIPLIDCSLDFGAGLSHIAENNCQNVCDLDAIENETSTFILDQLKQTDDSDSDTEPLNCMEAQDLTNQINMIAEMLESDNSDIDDIENTLVDYSELPCEDAEVVVETDEPYTTATSKPLAIHETLQHGLSEIQSGCDSDIKTINEQLDTGKCIDNFAIVDTCQIEESDLSPAMERKNHLTKQDDILKQGRTDIEEFDKQDNTSHVENTIISSQATDNTSDVKADAKELVEPNDEQAISSDLDDVSENMVRSETSAEESEIDSETETILGSDVLNQHTNSGKPSEYKSSSDIPCSKSINQIEKNIKSLSEKIRLFRETFYSSACNVSNPSSSKRETEAYYTDAIHQGYVEDEGELFAETIAEKVKRKKREAQITDRYGVFPYYDEVSYVPFNPKKEISIFRSTMLENKVENKCRRKSLPVNSDADVENRPRGKSVPKNSDADFENRPRGNSLPMNSDVDVENRPRGKSLPLNPDTDIQNSLAVKRYNSVPKEMKISNCLEVADKQDYFHRFNLKPCKVCIQKMHETTIAKYTGKQKEKDENENRPPIKLKIKFSQLLSPQSSSGDSCASAVSSDEEESMQSEFEEQEEVLGCSTLNPNFKPEEMQTAKQSKLCTSKIIELKDCVVSLENCVKTVRETMKGISTESIEQLDTESADDNVPDICSREENSPPHHGLCNYLQLSPPTTDSESDVLDMVEEDEKEEERGKLYKDNTSTDNSTASRHSIDVMEISISPDEDNKLISVPNEVELKSANNDLTSIVHENVPDLCDENANPYDRDEVYLPESDVNEDDLKESNDVLVNDSEPDVQTCAVGSISLTETIQQIANGTLSAAAVSKPQSEDRVTDNLFPTDDKEGMPETSLGISSGTFEVKKQERDPLSVGHVETRQFDDSVTRSETKISPDQPGDSATKSETDISFDQLEDSMTRSETDISSDHPGDSATKPETDISLDQLEDSMTRSETDVSPGQLDDSATKSETDISFNLLEDSMTRSETDISSDQPGDSATKPETDISLDQLEDSVTRSETDISPDQFDCVTKSEMDISADQLNDSMARPEMDISADQLDDSVTRSEMEISPDQPGDSVISSDINIDALNNEQNIDSQRNFSENLKLQTKECDLDEAVLSLEKEEFANSLYQNTEQSRDIFYSAIEVIDSDETIEAVSNLDSVDIVEAMVIEQEDSPYFTEVIETIVESVAEESCEINEEIVLEQVDTFECAETKCNTQSEVDHLEMHASMNTVTSKYIYGIDEDSQTSQEEIMEECITETMENDFSPSCNDTNSRSEYKSFNEPSNIDPSSDIVISDELTNIPKEEDKDAEATDIPLTDVAKDVTEHQVIISESSDDAAVTDSSIENLVQEENKELDKMNSDIYVTDKDGLSEYESAENMLTNNDDEENTGGILLQTQNDCKTTSEAYHSDLSDVVDRSNTSNTINKTDGQNPCLQTEVCIDKLSGNEEEMETSLPISDVQMNFNESVPSKALTKLEMSVSPEVMDVDERHSELNTSSSDEELLNNAPCSCLKNDVACSCDTKTIDPRFSLDQTDTKLTLGKLDYEKCDNENSSLEDQSDGEKRQTVSEQSLIANSCAEVCESTSELRNTEPDIQEVEQEKLNDNYDLCPTDTIDNEHPVVKQLTELITVESSHETGNDFTGAASNARLGLHISTEQMACESSDITDDHMKNSPSQPAVLEIGENSMGKDGGKIPLVSSVDENQGESSISNVSVTQPSSMEGISNFNSDMEEEDLHKEIDIDTSVDVNLEQAESLTKSSDKKEHTDLEEHIQEPFERECHNIETSNNQSFSPRDIQAECSSESPDVIDDEEQNTIEGHSEDELLKQGTTKSTDAFDAASRSEDAVLSVTPVEKDSDLDYEIFENEDSEESDSETPGCLPDTDSKMKTENEMSDNTKKDSAEPSIQFEEVDASLEHVESVDDDISFEVYKVLDDAEDERD